MSNLPADRVIIGMMAAIVVLVTVIRPAMAGYLSILLVGIFAVIYWWTRNWHDRFFYVACSGVLLVVICGAISIWEGLIIAWMVAGILATVTGVTVSVHDLPAVLAGGVATILITLMIELANHALLPIAILCGITLGFLAVIILRDYRFQKQYSGAPK